MRERDSSRNHDTYIVAGEARRQRTPRVSIGCRTGKTTSYWQREFAAARRGRGNNTFVERRARDYASATPWPCHRLRPCVHETPNDSRLVHWEDPRAGDAARTLRVSACAVPRVRLAATSSRPPGLSLWRRRRRILPVPGGQSVVSARPERSKKGRRLAKSRLSDSDPWASHLLCASVWWGCFGGRLHGCPGRGRSVVTLPLLYSLFLLAPLSPSLVAAQPEAVVCTPYGWRLILSLFLRHSKRTWAQSSLGLRMRQTSSLIRLSLLGPQRGVRPFQTTSPVPPPRTRKRNNSHSRPHAPWQNTTMSGPPTAPVSLIASAAGSHVGHPRRHFRRHPLPPQSRGTPRRAPPAPTGGACRPITDRPAGRWTVRALVGVGGSGPAWMTVGVSRRCCRSGRRRHPVRRASQ